MNKRYQIFDDRVYNAHDSGSVLNDDQALLEGSQVYSPELRKDVLRVRMRLEHSNEGLSAGLEKT